MGPRRTGRRWSTSPGWCSTRRGRWGWPAGGGTGRGPGAPGGGGGGGRPAPPRLYGELRRWLERDAIVIGDGGDFVSYAGRFVDTFTRGCFLDPGPFGCLGLGLGYAIGARL